jgi:hypothetical protein
MIEWEAIVWNGPLLALAAESLAADHLLASATPNSLYTIILAKEFELFHAKKSIVGGSSFMAMEPRLGTLCPLPTECLGSLGSEIEIQTIAAARLGISCIFP